MRRGELGFTLLEILVVLVILGMTIPLVSIGLSTTWKNFERLNVQNLTLAQAKLPAKWFRDSITHAILYHPAHPSVEGGARGFSLVTTAVPDAVLPVPQRLWWTIQKEDDFYTLAFKVADDEKRVIKKTLQPIQFQYFVGEEWLSDFVPSKAVLPRAVRIQKGGHVWVLGTPGRSLQADVPSELALFGEYEF